jgi:hypothetical protein
MNKDKRTCLSWRVCHNNNANIIKNVRRLIDVRDSYRFNMITPLTSVQHCVMGIIRKLFKLRLLGVSSNPLYDRTTDRRYEKTISFNHVY